MTIDPGGSALFMLWPAIALVLLSIGHAHARDRGRPASSVLASLLAPRAYRERRRLIVIGLAAALSASAVSSGPGPLLAVVAATFVADRLLPVMEVTGEAVPGGGRSRWLRAVTILGSTDLIVLAGLFFALPAALRASNLDHKVQQVLAGRQLASSPFESAGAGLRHDPSQQLRRARHAAGGMTSLQAVRRPPLADEDGDQDQDDRQASATEHQEGGGSLAIAIHLRPPIAEV
jgi:hypothetical protein